MEVIPYQIIALQLTDLLGPMLLHPVQLEHIQTKARDNHGGNCLPPFLANF